MRVLNWRAARVAAGARECRLGPIFATLATGLVSEQHASQRGRSRGHAHMDGHAHTEGRACNTFRSAEHSLRAGSRTSASEMCAEPSACRWALLFACTPLLPPTGPGASRLVVFRAWGGERVLICVVFWSTGVAMRESCIPEVDEVFENKMQNDSVPLTAT